MLNSGVEYLFLYAAPVNPAVGNYLVIDSYHLSDTAVSVRLAVEYPYHVDYCA